MGKVKIFIPYRGVLSQMHIVPWLLGSIFFGFSLLMNVVNAHGAEPKILFKISFDNEINAKKATGNPKATAVYRSAANPEAKPQFRESLPGYGSAFLIGEEPLEMEYDLKDNARYDRGTLCLWVRRIGPIPKDAAGNIAPYGFSIIRWYGFPEDGKLLSCSLYKWISHDTGLARIINDATVDFRFELGPDVEDGDWHLIAFTWVGTKVRAYVDGKMTMEADNFVLPQFNFMRVGTLGSRDSQGTRHLIDDVTFYDEAMVLSELKQLYRKGVGHDTPSTLTIPSRKNSITIDGKITEQEWAGAVETTGFVDLITGLAAPTQTHARLCYDDKSLYVAFTSEYPQRVKDDPAMTVGLTGALQQTRGKFDSDVDSDDSFEINIEPGEPRTKWYRFVMNGLNTHYDYEITGDYETGNVHIILDWNPEWESASFLDGDGWHSEIRIPFAAFGVPAPKMGDQWGLTLSRRWKALETRQDIWGFTRRGDVTQYGYPTVPVRFGGPNTLVISMKQWGAVHQGIVDLNAEIFNPSNTEQKVQVEVISDSQDLKEVQVLTIPASDSIPLHIAKQLKDFKTSQVMMTVSETATKEVLFRSAVLLKIPENLEIRTSHYPTKGIFRISLDVGRLQNEIPLKEMSVQARIIDKTGKSVVPAKVVQPLPSYQCSVELDVSKVSPGSYEAQCVLKHKDSVVTERTVTYEKQDMPEWYNNSLGITAKAPKPFTPVTRDGDTLGCWGRQYRYGGELFPKQIITKGSEILEKPVELILTDAAGKKYSTAGEKAESVWGKHTDFRIEYERSVQLAGVSVKTSSWLECDGFLWTRLILGPAKEGIQKLVLRLPIKKEWAEYINTSDYSSVRDGFLPEEGLRGLYMTLWLGNGYGGLQWIVETYADCRLPKGEVPLRVIRQANETLLEITLIDEPMILDKPFVKEFGFIATPVRPPTPEYRRWNTYTATWLPDVTFVGGDRHVGNMDWSGYNFMATGGIPSHYHKEPVKRDDGVVPTVILAPHIQISLLNEEQTPEYKYWGDEWSLSADRRDKGGGVYPLVSPDSRSLIDFRLWHLYQTYKKSRMPGVYYDCDMEPVSSNQYHDGGIQVGNQFFGKPTILGTRQFCQRIYVMLRELEPERTMIGLHSSGLLNLAYMGWCDWYGDGENFFSRLNKKEQDYHNIYRPDSFLAKSMGHNTGLTVHFLDQQYRAQVITEEEMKRLGGQPTLHLYGLILLHDSTFWQGYGYVPAYQMVQAALLKYKFDERYRVLAWYFDQKIVELPKNVFATFYRDDATGRVIVILLNNNDQDMKLHLVLDWKALGFDDWRKIKVDDAIFHEGASIEDGKLVTAIGFANMRMLVLEP